MTADDTPTPARASRIKLEDAKTSLRRLLEEQQAVPTQQRIEAAWRAGSEKFTAADWAAAAGAAAPAHADTDAPEGTQMSPGRTALRRPADPRAVRMATMADSPTRTFA